jgi:hypothetical protein
MPVSDVRGRPFSTTLEILGLFPYRWAANFHPEIALHHSAPSIFPHIVTQCGLYATLFLFIRFVGPNLDCRDSLTVLFGGGLQ